MRILQYRAVLAFLALGFASATAEADDEDALLHFENRVRPLIIERCLKCHGPEKQHGGLRLDSSEAMLAGGETGPAIVPGKPAESLMWQMIDSGEMPPRSEPRLTDAQQADVKQWLAAGAPMITLSEAAPAPAQNAWQNHWAFQRPIRETALSTLPLEAQEAFIDRPVLAGVAPREPDHAEVARVLEAWYRASNLRIEDESSVTVWPDASGNGRDLAPTLGAHPNGQGDAPTFIASSTINGRPAVRFDPRSGLGSPGNNPVPVNGDAPFTISIVLNLKPRVGGYPHDLVVSFGEFGAAADPGKPLAAGLGIQRVAGAGHRLSLVGGWGHDGLLATGTFATLYHRPCVITITKSPGPVNATARIFINGQPSNSFAGWGAPTGSTAAPDYQPRAAKDFSVMLGQAVAGAGAILGDVAEVLIYSAALNEQQRRGIEAGLATRYGLHELVGPAFQPVNATPTAAVHPIDAFIQKRLDEREIAPADPASKQTLVRRAYFDLLGLPPTPEQVDQFVNDSSPFAWEILLTELLSSPQYGERWGRHWLDVARYADSAGFETEEYHRNAWRYRDWVIKAFNEDKPYSRFVQEQLAADELWPATLEASGTYALPARQIARMEAQFGTGLFGLGTRIGESRLDAKLWRYEELTDWVDTVGSAFLGMTVGCARCHDHKFDPLTQRDYFRLQAIFQNTKLVERSILLEVQHSNWHTDYPHVLRVAAAREEYRLFESTLAGRSATPEEEAKLRELRARIADMVLAIPEAPPGDGPFAKRYDGLYEIPSVTVLGHELPQFAKPVHVLHRGDLERPQEKVTPGLPTALAAATDTESSIPDGIANRKQLALWLTQPDHPLTARVLVNRVWHWHFGRGLVATPSDFGRLGQAPTHPELLDYLATEFVASGWSIKSLHRLIMTSEVYRRSSLRPAEMSSETDPENRLLAYFPRRRLEGEAVWDAMHAAAGTLNLEMGGPPIAPPMSAEEFGAMRYRHQWVTSSDPAQHTRRGIYFVTLRTFRFPLFEIFDAPNNGISTATRDVSTVAPQALYLLNNHRSWKQAQHLAARVVKETGDQPTQWVTRLWRITLGRVPTELEETEALVLLDRLSQGEPGPALENVPTELASLENMQAKALVQLCLLMFSHSEFLYVD